MGGQQFTGVERGGTLWRTPRGGLQKEMVYTKRPFASPECVLACLGRYTHRTAISNFRILDVWEGKVSFTYRDRKDARLRKTMTLDAEEFIRCQRLHASHF